MTRLPAHILKELRNARAAAKSENANFAPFPGDEVTSKLHTKDSVTEPADQFVKRMIQVHHDTWIVGPLDRVIAWAEGADNDA